MRFPYRSRLLGTALLLFVGVASYGCKDFLDKPPQGALDEGTLANLAGVEASLIAAYRVLDHNQGVGGAWGTAASNWVWGSVTSDDAYKGSEASDQPAITDIELYNWTTGAADGYLNDKWRGAYEGVVRANATIKLLNALIEEGAEAISQEDQDGIRGEALFLRAHFHFEAWRLWENIPYYTEADTTFYKSNQGVDVIGSILADLEEAEGLLDVTPRKGEAGRVTSWTARAYRGKVLVYDEQWGEARTVLNQVVTSGPYELEEDFSRVWSGFGENANGPETILAYQASANDGEPSGNNANYGERLNFPHSGSPFGCCGFHQPTQNLVNFFQVDGAGLPLSLSDGNWNARNENLDAAASANLALDPRLDWTVSRDGVPVKDWGVHEPDWIRAPAFGGPYSPKKTIYEDASGAVSNVGWTNTQLSSMNIHILRYADVLLLLAEAEVEGGTPGNACALVNLIRDRASRAAQGPGDPMVVPIDDASITWANYQVNPYPSGSCSDAATAREIVRTERRLELAMEGERFFDLKRWGIAETTLNAYLAVERNRRDFLTGAAAFSGRHSLFPIPTVQIELSRVEGEDRLVQNPGW